MCIGKVKRTVLQASYVEATAPPNYHSLVINTLLKVLTSTLCVLNKLQQQATKRLQQVNNLPLSVVLGEEMNSGAAHAIIPEMFRTMKQTSVRKPPDLRRTLLAY